VGARLLADWLAAPLADLQGISHRHDAAEEMHRDARLRQDVRKTFPGTFDLTRLLGRVATQRCGPRDLQQIGRTLAMLPTLKARLTERKSAALQQIEADLQLCPELRNQLESALADNCPLSAADGHFIRPGFDEQLDNLRE